MIKLFLGIIFIILSIICTSIWYIPAYIYFRQFKSIEKLKLINIIFGIILIATFSYPAFITLRKTLSPSFVYLFRK